MGFKTAENKCDPKVAVTVYIIIVKLESYHIMQTTPKINNFILLYILVLIYILLLSLPP